MPIPPDEREGDVLAVDPGLEHPAVALIRDSTLLAALRIGAGPAWSALPILERCGRIAAAVARWAALWNPRWLVVEWPTWYPGSPVKPRDLAGLCGIAGAVAGALIERGLPLRCLSPEPREVWGQVPKATTGDPWLSPRAKRVAARLSVPEARAVESTHDAIDAAGLALWAVGRWERVRSMPGAV